MKIHVKKKRFKAFCRAQVVKGLINGADGLWREATSNTMDRSMIAGYKLR